GPYDLEQEGFRVPPSELQASVQTICLRAPRADLPIGQWALRSAWMEQFLAKKLGEAHFGTVPSERVERAAAEATKAAGGMYDPLTGRAMPAKRETVLRAEREALRSTLGCQAELAIEIHVVRLRWTERVAQWDYVYQDLGGGDLYIGTAQGLSLWLALRSLEGVPLLERAGGIESLTSIDNAFLSEPRLKDANPASLLNNTTWNARAAIAALGALAQQPSPATAQCVAQAKAKGKVDPVAQRALCEAQAFVFAPPPERPAEAADAQPAAKP
ncbi:MAG: hypothetical protein ACHQ6V_19845, partial [Myxococcota bacterium]